MPNWLFRRKDSHPNTTAVWHPDGEMTYRSLWERAAMLVGGMRAQGIPRSAHVAVLMRHGLQFAELVHACMLGEFRLVPLNVRLTPAELAFQLHDAGVTLLIHDDEMATVADAAGHHCKAAVAVRHVDHLREQPLTEPTIAHSIHLTDPFCIMYTSGTTGRPKGALLTYGNFYSSAVASALQLGLSLSENWLAPMPLYHVGGLSVLMRSVIYGTTASVLDKFDEALVNRLLDEKNVTLLSVVPAMLHRLLRQREYRPYPATLRTVLLGGSAADRPLLEQCRDLGVPVAQTYGLTETTSQVCTLPIADSLRKLGSAGKPLLTTEIRIVGEDGGCVPANEQGEIEVRGQTVSPGYWNVSTGEPARDGWFATGDIGYLDEEGYLFVLDRRTDLIVSGGENVYPAEIESVLLGHPDVLDAGVVGDADDTWGQVPVAFVHRAVGSELTEADLSAWCSHLLAGYKVPQRFVWTTQLPRNASGKLLRRTLRQWL